MDLFDFFFKYSIYLKRKVVKFDFKFVYRIPHAHPVSGRYGGVALHYCLISVRFLKLVAECEEDIGVERKKEQRH